MQSLSLFASSNYLFVPATHIERVEKAFDKGADSVIIDLEDAVSSDKKAIAWQNVLQYLDKPTTEPIWLRINASHSDFYQTDLQHLLKLSDLDNIIGIVLPKVTQKSDIENLHQLIQKPIIALIESPNAMANIDKIATSKGLFALSFGFLDICEQLNVKADSQAGEILLNQLRYQLLIHSKINGLIAPIEGVFAKFDEPDTLKQKVQFWQDLGFSGMLCIHPNQVSSIHEQYQASQDTLDFAKKVIDFYEKTGEAIFAIDGNMVDLPVIKQAYRILA